MSTTIPPASVHLSSADQLMNAGNIEEAIKAYLSSLPEAPPALLCLKLAQCYERLENYSEASKWAAEVVDAGDEYMYWQRAWSLIQRCDKATTIPARRTARVAILGSYTTIQFAQMLRLAAKYFGMRFDVYESHYGQYQQEIIDPKSGLYSFAPDIILLAVHEGELRLPDYSLSPREDVETEVKRWTNLWKTIAERSKARIVQHNFALPYEESMGHLGGRLSGSRHMMMQAFNLRLGEEAGQNISLVDCERLSAIFGKGRWLDPRYWYLSKQAVSLEALPLLAKHTAAVIAADLGLSKKCLVLDLDNTLWGGVIAEDGLNGIRLGNGADGEAFVAFQEYIIKLKNKGIILTVCSKNNYADAIEPFGKHPEMRLKLDHFAMFVANWEPKPDNLRKIAHTLGIGLDSLVFVDDNPAERAVVRQLVPEVAVIKLPAGPSDYLRTLAQYLMFETSSYTEEDAKRTDQYRARAQGIALEQKSGSLEEFYRDLQMEAIVAPFDELHVPRIAQLIGKTNQFNVTTRRYSQSQVEAFMNDPHCVHVFLRLRDRFTDHGLVSLLIARRQGDMLDIDTWLMSCRVIGRTVEAALLAHLCEQAALLGCTTIQGTYIPTPKNAMAMDVFGKFGFVLTEKNDEREIWRYDFQRKGSIVNPFIKIVRSWENVNERS